MEAREKDTTPRIEVINSENRRHPRFDIHLPVEYCQSKSSVAHTGNISEGGFLIYFPEEKDVNQHLSLKLFFSLGSKLDTIKVVGKVVWMDSHLSKDGEHYPYGVKFIDISPEDGNKLRNFLRSLSSPLDDMLYLFNTVKMRLWKLMNSTGVIATEKIKESLMSRL
jgi:c-di-GMP-binding flagellar brake protein YcgR